VVTVDVGYTITMVILKRLNLLLFRLILDIHLHTIILNNQHIGIFFHRWSWRKNWVHHVIKTTNI